MRVFTIPPTQSFVDALAKGVLARHGADPMALASVTILLPNRRACRALREAFLRETDGAPLLLPSIRPIGDVEEEALYLGASDPAAEVPPAISPLRRTLLLARYLMAYDAEYTYAQALAMAADLGRFLDSVETEGLSLDKLDTLVPDVYAAHWQKSLSFLKEVLRTFWPVQLQAEGSIDAGARRRMLIQSYTKSLQENPPAGPVIAAGSTGSIPVTAELLKTVASLPNGCVVLPGLDTVLEDEHWSGALEEGHPQAGLARLLLHFDMTRAEVVPWSDEKHTPREAFISALMRPAAAIGAWAAAPLPKGALDGISMLEADTLDTEATCIALMMRKHADNAAASDPCVLVTPDRLLANRVALQLRRWGIAIDDSAGIPLANTPIGQWILLLCDVLHTNLEPVSFLSLLKSGFAAGSDPNFRSFVRTLDKHVLRGPRPEEGFAGLKFAAAKFPDVVTQLDALEKIFAADTSTTDARLRSLVRIAENLASTPDVHGSHRLWAGEAGEAMADTLANLLEQTDAMPELDWAGCRAVLEAAMQGSSIRPRFGTHPHLAILGPIEARLYQSGTMILGGLNEGTWPRLPETDGWMSRGMRNNFGLPAPERGITLSSHDFAQGLGARNVVLTRSKTRDGAPTIPSRWLQRLDALCEAQPEKPQLRTEAQYWLDLAISLDAPEAVTPMTRPAPNPPRDARPTRLSVTEIAKWRRDPYYVFARRILDLKQLDPIAAEPTAADRGDLIHKALKRFGDAYPTILPDNAEEALIAIGREVFANAHQHPDVTGHWWPRFTRMASALVQHEREWRKGTLQVYSEVDALMPYGDFTLKGIADRIERRTDGWAIIDYKSGQPPSKTKVNMGDEPQLTLLGAMMLAGCYNEKLGTRDTPQNISALSYWKTGGGEETLKTTTITDTDKLCAEAREGLRNLINAYMHDGLAYT
ncbi:MAG: PD-(D/E)XK nuclease family protein, partial [Alphaproteobacteria bacterium]|nr:PD-(D/E)XK nuclease family protein [Alphaproteobacteria bacterium]